jgi:apolipoprotein N-acyltransferase
MMIVQTNNATFADSGQSMQQLNISRIRAVENNKWIVSVSTTGVSAIIDNNGKIRQITEQNEPSFVSGKVLLNSKESVASNLGNWSSLISILLAFVIYLRKRRLNV